MRKNPVSIMPMPNEIEKNKLSEDEFQNLVMFAESKGFEIKDLDKIWVGIKNDRNQNTIKVAYCSGDYIFNGKRPYYVFFGNLKLWWSLTDDNTEIYRLSDMKPWREIWKEKEQENAEKESVINREDQIRYFKSKWVK